MNRSRWLLPVIALALGGAAFASEAHEEKPHEEASHAEGAHERVDPPELYLSNFFSAGWNEKFEEHPDHGRAPRFSLFQSRQGFLERVALVKATETHGLENKSTDESEGAVELEWAANRRFELDFEAFSAAQHPQRDEGRSGHDLRFVLGTRIALSDTRYAGYTLEPRVTTRSTPLGQRQTELSLALAGFHDLTPCGFYRTGLYTTLECIDRVGGIAAPGDPLPAEIPASRFLKSGLTLAKTFDGSDPHHPLEFTTFLEALATEALDGDRRNQTAVTLTPGLRLSPWRDGRKWIQMAVELPVSNVRFSDRTYLFAFLQDF